ncbi:MAG: glycosyltransferase family 9 protein [Bacteroidetes bacterium]|nr:glycosyltransferase family 9 protein [Bacteroidota bacterium]
MRCIKQQISGSEIHYLTKKMYHPVLKANPYIDKIHLFENNLDELIALLKAENFDHVIDLHKNLRSLRVKLMLGKPSNSFNKLNFEKWLLVNLNINYLPNVHIVDRYLETAKSLGVVNDLQGLDYFIPQEEEVNLNSLPEQYGKGFTGFVIGGQYATKQLEAEKITAICTRINNPIILLGGKEDFETGEKISSHSGRKKVLNGCGKYSLNQSASLVRQAKNIISHDTGLMHIAAAFKKDIVSVWGNTVPEFGMYPYMPGKNSFISEVKVLPCRPCSKIGYGICPKTHFACMKLQDELEIIIRMNA